MNNMKKIETYLIMFSLFLILCGNRFAQSDYQTVQDFKAKQQKIEESIRSAQSLDELNDLQAQIEQLRNDYFMSKELLDKSLYPDDFNSSINRLSYAMDTRKGDFAQITTLKVQVSEIQTQLDSLNAKNTELMSQIDQIRQTDSKDVAGLSRTINELKNSLAKRDRVIISMLAGMLPNSEIENGNLTNHEKQQIFSESKKSNVMANIKNSIDDNIKFLSMTNLSTEDLNTIKRQQIEFEKIWHTAGAAIAAAYTNNKENTEAVNDIENQFSAWNNSIDQVAWASIKQKFTNQGINLNDFSNGDEFVRTVSSYIDNEVKNAGENKADSKNLYSSFDSIWSNDIRPAWVPYLLSNHMISNTDDDKIEAKLDSWESTLNQNNYMWLYAILGVLGLIIIVSMAKVALTRKNKLSHSTVS
jgi:hypothetical protein